MLLKPGVDISRLKPPIRKKLKAIEMRYQVTGEEMVVTSTYEGTHGPGSLHYADMAIDLRRPAEGAVFRVSEIAVALGDDYDVVLDDDHIHIEYDPKGS